MTHIYKISYIVWVGNNLHSGGQINVMHKRVMAVTQWTAALKLRDSVRVVHGNIEITSITDEGAIDIQ